MSSIGVNIMSMPPARVSSRWVTSRSDTDQLQIKKMAEMYFAGSSQLSYLKQILNKDLSSLAFDGEELAILKSRTSLEALDVNLQDTLPMDKSKILTRNGSGIMQFYDFCLTVDSVKNTTRLLYGHLINSQDLDENSFKALEQEIFYPSFIPEFVLKDKDKKGYDISRLANYSVISDKMSLYAASNYREAPRTNINRAESEAVFLKSLVYNCFQALSQGLFIVHETRAQKLKNSIKDKDTKITQSPDYSDPTHVVTDNEADQIPKSSWINTFQEQTIMYSVKANNSVDGDLYSVNGDSPYCYKDTDASRVYVSEILQPKYIEYEYYNLLLISPKEDIPDDKAINDIEKRKHVMAKNNKITTGMQSMQKTGGAIGCYIDYWRHAADYDTDGGTPVPASPDTSYINGFRFFESNNKDVGLKLEIDNIHKVMSRFYFHPISSCPNLSRVYSRSGTQEQVWNMIQHLQRALEASAKTRESTSYARGFNVATLKQSRELGGVLPQCGPGYTTQFFRVEGDDGKGNKKYLPISEDEALVSRDGTLELASHVARDKMECVPRVTIGEIGGKASLDNLKFHPVIVPEISERPVDVRTLAPPSAFAVDYSQLPPFQYDSAHDDIVGPEFSKYLV
jgi:hypothetical protein